MKTNKSSLSNYSKPILGLTMGDAGGIGPEIIVKKLHSINLNQDFIPIVIGNTSVLSKTAKQLGLEILLQPITADQFSTDNEAIQVININVPELDNVGMGYAAPPTGELAYQSIKTAVELAQNKTIDAIVTAPICKDSLHMAGHKFDGHTGLIAYLTNTSNYRMLFAAESLKIIHTTAHIALSDVPQNLTINSVYQTISLGDEHMKALGYKNPKIAVCGLNPHASENGIFGTEDLDVIKPAIKKAKNNKINVSGPHPADALFRKAFNGEYDMVVAQYHDQGHIPGKLMAFDTAVNVTVGLPIIRTSVDHGTAFDIAGKGVADYENLSCAIKYAMNLIG